MSDIHASALQMTTDGGVSASSIRGNLDKDGGRERSSRRGRTLEDHVVSESRRQMLDRKYNITKVDDFTTAIENEDDLTDVSE